VAMKKFFHLDHVISVQSSQEEIQTLLDRFIEISARSLGVVDFQFGGGILTFIE
jgi:hypothetical protein